ncbi:MAG TPA: hypothetical protein VK034_18370 [Enhygromyxa sp.]|nr:hypothetical protein [Enhygromyxa sp.]
MPQTDQPPQSRAATSSPLPADVDPWVIASDPTLDRQAKLERLHQLELDVRLVENALEEGMTGSTRLPPLTEVLAAIDRVSNHEDHAHPTQTKI